MDILRSLGLLAIDAAVVGCTLHYVLFCLHRAPNSAPRKIGQRPCSSVHSIKRYAYYFFVFIGFFALIDGAVQTLLFWAPDTTLSYDESHDQFYNFHYKDAFASLAGLFGSFFCLAELSNVSTKLDELEVLRMENAERAHLEWRKTEDAKNWVEMDDGELVEVENLHWERFQGRKWKSCYEPPDDCPHPTRDERNPSDGEDSR